MLTVSGQFYRHARRIGYIGAIVVAVVIVFLATLIGGAGLIGGLLEPASEPIVAAPLRW